MIYILAAICFFKLITYASAINEVHEQQNRTISRDHFPEIPRVQASGNLNCSGTFFNHRVVVTDCRCVLRAEVANVTIEVRNTIGHDIIYTPESLGFVECSKFAGLSLLLLKNPVQDIQAPKFAEIVDEYPQKGQFLSVISWNTAPSARSKEAQESYQARLELEVKMSSTECAKELGMKLRGINILICANLGAGISLPSNVIGGSLVNRNMTVVGIVSFTKSLGNGEVLVVSTALATQHELIDTLSRLLMLGLRAPFADVHEKSGLTSE